MFGRVRASSSSLESLEGSPSKILRDDSLSIYEATLMKLKLGAQRDLNLPSKEASGMVTYSAIGSTSRIDGINLEEDCTPASSLISQNGVILVNERTMMDTESSSLSTTPTSSDCQSTGSTGTQIDRHVSVLDLFGKFESSKVAVSSSCGEPCQ
ncbi:Up-regulator of cell proliferation like [Quillaja saponaria]|uniref:Up-regulator of cell proliferation like n=1 Tax=Quillaja saponaria TaxID=32244 RepID=A0AAD7KTY2_QUISA|nr:Up-regulator of cell proliferation like [Quillaja saponaria]